MHFIKLAHQLVYIVDPLACYRCSLESPISFHILGQEWEAVLVIPPPVHGVSPRIDWLCGLLVPAGKFLDSLHCFKFLPVDFSLKLGLKCVINSPYGSVGGPQFPLQ